MDISFTTLYVVQWLIIRNKKTYNPFETAQKQFDRAADLLELDQATRDLLHNPLREFHFSIPIRMNDGSMKVFKGLRVQHNDQRSFR